MPEWQLACDFWGTSSKESSTLLVLLFKSLVFHYCCICLFILAALGLRCSLQAPHCDIQASLAVVRGLSCHTACGILVPRPGIEPAFPALEGRFLTTGPQGKFRNF